MNEHDWRLINYKNEYFYVQERMEGVYNLVVNDIYVEHNKAAASIAAINKLHDKARQGEQKLTNANKVSFLVFTSRIFIEGSLTH